MWAIDLGSTNTGVARWNEAEGRPRLVELPDICRQPGGEDHLEAPALVPSAVEVFEHLDFWARAGRWKAIARRFFWGKTGFIGRRALERNSDQPSAAYVHGFKAELGQSPLRTIARIGRKPLSARDVARIYVRELLYEIKKVTGEKVKELVVTTPVDAYESYRAELSEAFRSHGVRKVRFVDEPVAAAIGYGLGLKQKRTVLVVDFGGGTLDLALVNLTAKGIEEGHCEVIAKDGRPIGGNTVDEWLLDEFCRQLAYPVPTNDGGAAMRHWTRMMTAEVCRIKEALFFAEKETFYPLPPDELHSFEERIRGESPHVDLTKQGLEEILRKRGLYDTLEECLEGVLAKAQETKSIKESDIEDVLMVGGSTLLPGVYPLFEKRFGRDSVRAFQPFEAVAYGACAYSANASAQSDYIVHDYAFVTHDLETHKKQYSIIIPQGTRFPTPMDFWKKPLVPTCSLGTPETIFKLVICEVGKKHAKFRTFAWDQSGNLHKLGGRQAEDEKKEAGDDGNLVVPLNESNPTLGYLKPPHPPGDKRPRLEISFGVNADRWLCATVYDLRSKKYMMREQPVVRLL